MTGPRIDPARAAARLMQMDASVWARHVNPWSGWSRLSTLPLLAIAVWSRVWLVWGALVPIAVVLLWTWLNPRLFRAPRSTDNWMSRGVLGERLWLSADPLALPDHHVRMARLLSGATFVGVLVLGHGLVVLDPGFTVAGIATTMLAKLWFLDRMVWMHADMSAYRT
jgi:hypothetical protein